MAYFSHKHDLESGKAPPTILHVDDVETRSRLIDESFFGARV